jgi:glucose dehydrogenase
VAVRSFRQHRKTGAQAPPGGPGAAIWLLAAMLLGTAARSAGAAQPGDWPTYNRDLAGTRYSPLTQIDADNVRQLREVWSYSLGRNETSDTLSGGSEFTPIVVGGVMYLAASNRVVALDAATGTQIWRYDQEQGSEPPSRRGIALWPGDADHEPRLYFTAGRRLIGIDVMSGERFWRRMPVRYDGAPTVYKNLVIVGSNSAPGSVRAFDARTGEQAWVFNAVPGPGQVGHETWENDDWRNQEKVLHWAFSVTLDAARGLLYAVFESPGPDDYYGGNRPGDNLFGDSIVALDAETGERQWHFQTVHHDLWDYDLPAPPALLDVEIDGKNVPILAEASKTGYVYLLNRVTGKPIFGIKERRVPQSDVPGEHSSPTQPIPVKPPPVAKVSFDENDIVTTADTNEEHAAMCRALFERSGGFRNLGPFTPYGYREPGEKPRSTIVFPGSIGGANWGGMAADPSLGYVFVNTSDEGSIGWIEKIADRRQPEGVLLPYGRNSVSGRLSRFWSKQAEPQSGGNVFHGAESDWPCNKPPWGSLVAVDAATGEIAWRVPLGITEELGEKKQHTGRLNIGGPITTASGLIFIGASNDRRFRAFDSKTGKELWSARLPASAHSVPITYLGRDGRQYVAVVAAGASGIDDPLPGDAQKLVVFALRR